MPLRLGDTADNDSAQSQKVLGTFSVLPEKSLEGRCCSRCYGYLLFLRKERTKEIKLDHDMAKAQWRKERDQIENSYQNEIEKREKSRKAYEVAIKMAEEKKAKSTTALEKQKVEDTKKLIKASKNDPEKLDQILKDLGIEEV